VDNKPVTLVAIDNERKPRQALAVIRPMIREGVVVLLDAEVVPLPETPLTATST
jgi:PII-like signaling protein